MTGITRDVFLWSAPKTRIRDYFAITKLTDNYTNSTVDIEATVEGAPLNGTLTARIMDGGLPVAEKTVAVTASGSYNISMPVSNPRLWNALFNCSSLTSVEIPNSVTSIGKNAFAGCSSLTSVYYNSTEPVRADNSIFSDGTYSNATLYVPESAIGTFKQTEPWRRFQNIQGYDFPSGVEDVTAGLDGTQPCEYFNLSGVKMGNTKGHLAPGIYIMRQGNASRKIIVK